MYKITNIPDFSLHSGNCFSIQPEYTTILSKFITEKKGIVNLTPRLVDAIMLRTKYPESSLSDLSEVSEEEIGRKISKSGLNHCFKDIHELYEKLNGGNKWVLALILFKTFVFKVF